MNSDIVENRIIVKHLPKEFSLKDCEEFFSFFNSKSVSYFSEKGPMQHTAIVTFGCFNDAHSALFSLHEQKVLNTRLCAQFLKAKTNVSDNSEDSIKESHNSKDSHPQLVNAIPEWVTKLLSVAPKWGLNGPIQPKLKYNYPKPNNIILTNIVRSLVSNNSFYTQTLHLMNKFHLPVPFTENISFPGYVTVVNNEEITDNKMLKRHRSTVVESTEMEISSGNESEVSDEDYSPKVKRGKLSFPKIPIIPLITNYDYNVTQNKTISVDEVFEENEKINESHIEFLPIPSIAEINNRTSNDERIYVENGFGRIDEEVDIDLKAEILENFKLRKDKIIQDSENAKETEKSNIVCIKKPNKIYSFEEIKDNILAKQEWLSINALKNYHRGTPSNQLYIKNISKKVSKDDLISLYAGFVDWSNELEVESFQITYFTEGRMKGQAFVCFYSKSVAERALELTNAFNFFEKPISVQFSKNSVL